MHVDAVHTDAALVRRLLAAQFPEWAALPIERVPSSGTDNALYRLGNDMVARLPRTHRVVESFCRGWHDHRKISEPFSDVEVAASDGDERIAVYDVAAANRIECRDERHALQVIDDRGGEERRVGV